MSRLLSLFTGPFFFLHTLLLPAPGSLPEPGWITLGITLWMAIWWISEVVPVSVTALLPLALFPLTSVMPLGMVAAEFGSEIVFLFLSGFFFGAAIERWNLHRRIALNMVLVLGQKPSGVVLGFMAATVFLSMWISNTATAVMMTPVAIAMGQSGGKEQDSFRKALLLGVAYACSIGGLGTIIGTPTNGIFIGHVQDQLQMDISFGQWMLFGLPLAVVLTLCCWLLLIVIHPMPRQNGDVGYKESIRMHLAELGPMTIPEKRLVWLFSAVVLAWITGSLFWYKLLTPKGTDTLVAICGAILLFLIPARSSSTKNPLLDWPTAQGISWGILLFFGGGLALAEGFKVSGLADWIGQAMTGLQAFSPIVLLFIVLLVVVALSEVASNIATASIMMPVLQSVAETLGYEPPGLLLAAALAASFGFGLPVATAPNAIVFASGFLRTKDMVRAGFLLDVIAVVVLLGFVWWVLPHLMVL